MKKVLVLLAGAMLVLVASTAWAVPTIEIFDLTGASLSAGGTGFRIDLVIGRKNPVITYIDDESVEMTGSIYSGFIDVNVPTIFSIEMLEPASEGGGVSDYAILRVEPLIRIADPPTQFFDLTFYSKGATGFDAALTGPSIVEDGTMQNLWTFDGLVISAASDVVPVPLPASVLLFSTGLLGLVPVWRLRRKA